MKRRIRRAHGRLGGYLAATLLALLQPWLTLAATALLALLFVLGPSSRAAD